MYTKTLFLRNKWFYLQKQINLEHNGKQTDVNLCLYSTMISIHVIILYLNVIRKKAASLLGDDMRQKINRDQIEVNPRRGNNVFVSLTKFFDVY
jgi:hypothetical protein